MSLFCIAPENQRQHLRPELLIALQIPQLLKRLVARMHEAVVAPEIELDRVTGRGAAQRRMNSTSADRRNTKFAQRICPDFQLRCLGQRLQYLTSGLSACGSIFDLMSAKMPFAAIISPSFEAERPAYASWGTA
jgi:hypothetical protein